MNVIAPLAKILSHQVLGLSVFMYLGILALLSLLVTAYLARQRKPNGYFMKWHHYLVVLSLSLALLHAVSGLLATRLIGDTNDQYHFDAALMTSSEIVAGQKIFSEICSGCHENGGNIININLPMKGSHKLANYATFLSFIRNPKMPDGSTGAMPSFPESRVSSDEAKKLYQYIVSEYGLNHNR
jgi:mono/diheme cytochrome c family protein